MLSRDLTPAARCGCCSFSALAAYFYAYIALLLGIVTVAAGLRQAIGHAGSILPYPACLALGGGVALYLAGDAAFRHALRIGTLRYRATAAAVALVASAVGVTVSVAVEIALLTVIVAAALVIENRDPQRGSPRGSGGTGPPKGGPGGWVPPGRSRGGLGGIVPPETIEP